VITDDLRRAPLFAGLTDEQLAKLGAIADPMTLPPGVTVFLQGDPADAVYLLAAGAVKVAKVFRDGRSATIRHVRVGETFGESVLFNETYPASTETMGLEPSLLYRFDTGEFRRLMLAEPELALRITHRLVGLAELVATGLAVALLPLALLLAHAALAHFLQ
jgi:CRP/FNR family transcriptional regulator